MKMRLLLSTMSEGAAVQLASEGRLSARANIIELRKQVKRTARRSLEESPRGVPDTGALPPNYEPLDRRLRESPIFASFYGDASYVTQMVDLQALVPAQRFVYVERGATFTRPIPGVDDLDGLWDFCFPQNELPAPSLLNGFFVLNVPADRVVPGPSSVERLPHGGFKVELEFRPRGELLQVMREGRNLVVIQGHHRFVALLESGHRWAPALVRTGPWPLPDNILLFPRAMVGSRRALRLSWFLDPTCYADIECSELNDKVLIGAQLQRTVA